MSSFQRRGGLLTAGAVAFAFALTTLALPAPAHASGPSATSPAAGATVRDAAASGSSGDLWQASDARPRATLDGHRRRVDPARYAGYTLDAAGMRNLLAGAPSERASLRSPDGGATGVVVSLPAPDGSFVDFSVVDSPVMQSRLAAAHPELRTYAGRSLDGTATVRLDQTPMGFHAFVRGTRGGDSWMIDPAYDGDDSLYLSYLTSDVAAPAGGLDETEEPGEGAAATPRLTPHAGEAPGAAVVQRTYRLALTTDPSYATYFGTQNVLAEKVTLMNRVDEIYTNDLAVKMVLINDEDLLNLDTDAKAYGANGPCGPDACFTTAQISNGCGSSLLSANRAALGQIVGAENFDIGHIGLGINGGGIASLGVVGGSNKAQGCTGLPQPEGDFYAVDYVAHEMGHEFAGNHTFNGTQYNCASGNRNGTTSVEPGSGTSVMAYAGICQQDNLQPHSDPYFSQRSQSEITTYITRTLTNVNDAQTVGLGGFTDPAQYLTLTVTGTDGLTHTTAPIYQSATVPTDAPAGSQPYTVAGIKSALETALGATAVTVYPYGASRSGTLTSAGFTVVFNLGSYLGTDVAPLTVTVSDPTVTTRVGTTAQGGPATNGGTATTTTNHTPVVTAAAPRTIPVQTPFTLTGSGTDADDDPLVYLWEQNDIGPNDTRTGTTTTPGGTGLVQQPKTNGPLFRVFGTYADVSAAGTLQQHSPGENLADGSPSRTFPDMAQILANNTDAETGTCPAAPPAPATGGATNVPVATIDCFSEFLPTPAYVGYTGSGNASPPSLDFRLTARDQDPAAGGTSYADTKLTLDPGAGPFLVTTKSTANPPAAVAGRSEAVTWNVANTNGYTDGAGTVHPSLATAVRITLSTDGGQSFPYVLADSTPNDGSQVVTWPNVSTDHARIEIQAVDNYFFDVNNDDFSIVPRLLVSGGSDGSTLTAQYSDPLVDAPTYRVESGAASSGADLTATATGLPDGLSLTRTDASAAGTEPATATYSVTGDVADDPGTYPVTVVFGDGSGATSSHGFTVVVTPEDATVAYTGPATASATDGDQVTVTAQVTPAADGTPGDLTRAPVRFTDDTTGDVLCAAAPTTADGTSTCTFTAELGDSGARTYAISEEVDGDYTAASTTPGALRVETPPAEQPDTQIVSGPADHGYFLGSSASVGFTSTVPQSTFACTLDGADLPCPASPAKLTGLTAATHTFTVAATADGVSDPTPATLTFTVPVDDRQLTDATGDWQRRTNASAYRGTLTVGRSHRATLERTVTGATSLALIAPRQASLGAVQIYLGDRLVKTIALNTGDDYGVHKIIPIWSGPAYDGVVRIVHSGTKEVRIDGLAVATGGAVR